MIGTAAGGRDTITTESRLVEDSSRPRQVMVLIRELRANSASKWDGRRHPRFKTVGDEVKYIEGETNNHPVHKASSALLAASGAASLTNE
jgi:hypothetical protein